VLATVIADRIDRSHSIRSFPGREVDAADLRSRRGRDVGPDGHRVEQVMVQRSLSRLPKLYLRVRRGTYFIQDCATVEEVAQLVDLATLVREQR
jgi:hypothetical protein